jgi:hypothetical protein
VRGDRFLLGLRQRDQIIPHLVSQVASFPAVFDRHRFVVYLELNEREKIANFTEV